MIAANVGTENSGVPMKMMLSVIDLVFPWFKRLRSKGCPAWIGQTAQELAKAAGARRAVPLPVSAPFHCPLMIPAQQRLRADLDACQFAGLSVPLVNNWQAREVRTGAEAREGLYQQVPNAVRWTETIQHLAAQGVTRFVEVGAGKVLAGLVKSIAPEMTGFSFGEAADLEKLAG